MCPVNASRSLVLNPKFAPKCASPRHWARNLWNIEGSGPLGFGCGDLDAPPAAWTMVGLLVSTNSLMTPEAGALGSADDALAGWLVLAPGAVGGVGTFSRRSTWVVGIT